MVTKIAFSELNDNMQILSDEKKKTSPKKPASCKRSHQQTKPSHACMLPQREEQLLGKRSKCCQLHRRSRLSSPCTCTGITTGGSWRSCKAKDIVCEVICQLQIATAAVLLCRMAVTVSVSLVGIETGLHSKDHISGEASSGRTTT
jgi:hypothetical protein